MRSQEKAFLAAASVLCVSMLCVVPAHAAPYSPAPVASIRDGSGLDYLDGAWDVTTVTIGSKTYALFVSFGEDGVQIVDITNPARPVPVASFRDGDDVTVNGVIKTYDVLKGSRGGITTANIGNSTYALVAVNEDDGVQIVDITDPARPVPVASVSDGNGGFNNLNGAWDVTTVTIGNGTYALVAARGENSVQIIDITDPASPQPAAFAKHNQNGFTELNSVTGITTVMIGTGTYALATAHAGNGVQIINITDPTSPQPAAAITRDTVSGMDYSIFYDPTGITTATIGSNTYALVTLSSTTNGGGGGGFFVIDITDPAHPQYTASFADGDGTSVGGKARYFNELNDATGITTATIGSDTYALVAAPGDDGVQIIDITDPANSVPVTSINDNDPVRVNGIIKKFAIDNVRSITTVVIDSKTYALAAAGGDGVQIIDLDASSDASPLYPVPAASIDNGDTVSLDGVKIFDELDGAWDITTVTIGNGTYALVAADEGDGVQIIDITNLARPVPVASVTDGVGGFDELLGARYITTTTIGDSTYALVAARHDDGVQIIDITDPTSPAPVASVDKDDEGFDELDGAHAVTPVTIGDDTYALVAARDSNGVQIINITDPTRPTPAASVTHNSTYPTLQTPRDITTVTIGSHTYALIAAQHSNGVQIINITDPARPTPASSVTDGVDGFDELDRPRGITTVTIGDSTYALVAAYRGDGVQIINITDPARPTPASSVTQDADYPELDGPRGITTVTIGSHTYALVAAWNDDGVQIINITDPTSPTPASSVTDGTDYPELDGAWDVTTVTTDAGTYALVAAHLDDGVQIINITDPANPAPVASFDELDEANVGVEKTYDKLDSPYGITTATIGSDTYALVTAIGDDGIQIVNVTNPAEPKPVASLNMSSFTLTVPLGITTTTIGSDTYALVAVGDDDGVQIINITTPTNPQNVTFIKDGVGGFTELNGARGITTTVIGGNTYALVASTSDDGVQIIDITNPASPASAASIDGGSTYPELEGAWDITTAKIGSGTYALVASRDDNGVQIIDITDPTSPVPAASIANDSDGFDRIDDPRGIATTKIGSKTYALVTSNDDHGVQIIDITTPTSPQAVTSFDEGDTVTAGGVERTYSELRSAFGITTAKIGSGTYALVSAQSDDGIQVVDITNPHNPIPATPIGDGAPVKVDGIYQRFDELNGPRGITTAVIGSNVYALVASLDDDGVQIIDLGDAATTAPPPQAFVTTWGINSADRNITIPVGGATGTYTVYWGDGDVTTHTGNADHTYPGIGTYQVVIVGDFTRIHLAGDSDNARQIRSIDQWGYVQWESMAGAFKDAYNMHYRATDVPDLSGVTDMSEMFYNVEFFDGDLSGWNVSSVTNMEGMFRSTDFDGDLSGWNVSSVTNMANMFHHAEHFNSDLSRWDVSSVTSMKRMFSSTPFNGNLSGWDVSGVTNMQAMFGDATAFNSDLSGWNVSGVKDMSYMFNAAASFDSDLSGWNVSGANVMEHMLRDSPSSRHNLGEWYIMLDDASIDFYASPGAVGEISAQNGILAGQATYAVGDGADRDSFEITDNSVLRMTVVPDKPLYAVNITSAGSFGDNNHRVYYIDLTSMGTTPADPQPAASFEDGDGVQVDGVTKTYEELASAFDIATATIGLSTYALVTAIGDDGVQIVDVTDPANPSPAASIMDGTTFTLEDPHGIATATIGLSTYALVAANGNDGVQIINITDPASPVPTASITNGTGGFDRLGGAFDIATAVIDSHTYALVAANGDNGVQIINITDPADPTAVASVTNGVDGFGKLHSPRGIATAVIDSHTYALVASYYGNGVQIIDITDPADPTHAASVGNSTAYPKLSQAQDITTVTIGSDTYALVASRSGSGVQIIDITDPADPAPVASIGDGDQVTTGGIQKTYGELQGSYGITTIAIGSGTYALVAADGDDGVQIIDITDPARPVPAASISNDAGGFDKLGGPRGITTAVIGPNAYALVASFADGGVQVIDLGTATGKPAPPEDWFVTTWKTNSPNSSITIPVDGATGNYTVRWGDGHVTTHTGDAVHTYADPGTHTVSISGNLTRIHLNHDPFNAPLLASIDQWGDMRWTSMRAAFHGAFNMEYKATDTPDLSEVTDMSLMFHVTDKFNGNLSGWDVSGVTGMTSMFRSADSFNGDLSGWDVSGVDSMAFMFHNAESFNGNISGWDVSGVQRMDSMFKGADSFNGDLSGWNVSGATDMEDMFLNTQNFDQNLGEWYITLDNAYVDLADGTTVGTISPQNDWLAGSQNGTYGIAPPDSGMFEIVNGTQLVARPDADYTAKVDYVVNITSTHPFGANNHRLVNVTVTDTSAAFKTTWKTDSPGESVTIPATGTYTINWGDGTIESVTGQGEHTYATAGNHAVAITGGLTRINLGVNETNAAKLVSIDQWGNMEWTTMAEAFFRALNMEYKATDTPDLSGVTSMQNMFRDAKKFDGNLSGWDVSGVTNMNRMFYTAQSFDGDLSGWDVSGVTDMNRMFYTATVFNGNLSGWDVSAVTNMNGMFNFARSFNGNISSWDVSSVTGMNGMFASTNAFNGNLSGWNVSSVTNMSHMFNDAESFNGDLSGWDVSSGPGMSGMFYNAESFNGNISGWDVSGVTNMNSMFNTAESFNGNISGWNVSGVTNMGSMFNAAAAFDQDISGWDVSGVTDMEDMFTGADSFDQNLGEWYVVPADTRYETTEASLNVTAIAAQNSQLDGHTFDYGIGDGHDSDSFNMTGSTLFFKSAPTADQAYSVNVTASANATGIIFGTGNHRILDITVTETNVPPVLASIPPRSVTELDLLEFTAEASDGNPGDSLVFSLDGEPDGAAINPTTGVFSWIPGADQSGTHDITVRVSDGTDAVSVVVTVTVVDSDTAFVTTWEVKTSPYEIHIPVGIRSGATATIVWGDGSATDVSADGTPQHAYAAAGNYTVAITGGLGRINIVDSPSQEKLVSLDRWGDTEWTTMNRAFSNAINMTYSATDAPDLSGVDSMHKMFFSAPKFNGNLSGWDVSSVTNMGDMFAIARSFDGDISTWNVSSVTSMKGMFGSAESFNGDISSWDTSGATDMKSMFSSASLFNGDISEWDVSSVNDMEIMFQGATRFNQDLSGWNVSSVKEMSSMFRSATSFDSDLSGWDVSSVKNMISMFEGATSFGGDLSGWSASSVISMNSMFRGATSFNGNLSGWDVSSVESTSNMFEGATSFNGSVSAWDVSSVSSMTSMFEGATSFNGNVSAWDPSASFMNNMFLGATAFNSDISGWDVSNVFLMTDMLTGATSFRQNLGEWYIMLDGTSISADGAPGTVGAISAQNNFLEGQATYGIGDGGDMNSFDIAGGDLNMTVSPDKPLYTVNITSTGGFGTGNHYRLYNVTVTDLDTGAPTITLTGGSPINVTAGIAYSDPGAACEDDTDGIRTVSTDDTNVDTQTAGTYQVTYTCTDSSENEATAARTVHVTPVPEGAFVTTWSTESANDTITIPVGSAAGNYTVHWGDGSITTHVTDAEHEYAASGNHTVSISGDFTQIWLFGDDAANAAKLKSIEQWGSMEWTTMEGAFQGASSMVYNATGAPDLSQVTDMSSMFYNTRTFNGDISTWNTSSVTNMSSMFSGANLFNGDISTWNTSSVTNMYDMFSFAEAFNGDLSDWDTSSVTNMYYMFYNADKFNGDISTWNTSSVTTMSGMFESAPKFNGDISTWNTSSVTGMFNMFNGADAFNQDISGWDVSSVTNMASMFDDADAFEQNLGPWYVVPADTSYDHVSDEPLAVTTISAQNQALDGHTPNYDIGTGGDYALFNMTGNTLFFESVPQAAGIYTVNVTAPGGDFGAGNHKILDITVTGIEPPVVEPADGAFVTVWETTTAGESITIPVGGATGNYTVDWGDGSGSTTHVTDAEHTYDTAGNYTVSISGDFTRIYLGDFSVPDDYDNAGRLASIVQWGDTKWATMEGAFVNAHNMAYNATNAPDLSAVTSMQDMFHNTAQFDGNLSGWDTSSVTDMSDMFWSASSFNGNVSTWDVSSVTDMSSMFLSASSFNGNVSTWDVSSVTDMEFMFSGAADFNSDWNVSLRYRHGQHVLRRLNLQRRPLRLERLVSHRHDQHVRQRRRLQLRHLRLERLVSHRHDQHVRQRRRLQLRHLRLERLVSHRHGQHVLRCQLVPTKPGPSGTLHRIL